MQKGFAPIFVLLAVLAVLVLAGGAYYLSKTKSPEPQQAQNNTTISQPTQSVSPSNQPAKVEDYKSSNRIIYTQTGDIFTTDGKTKKQVGSNSGLVRELAVSLDGQKLAYNYSTNEVTYYNYPKTGLTILNINDGKSNEVIPLKDTVVRYPVWSDDSKYLSVWINNGGSSRVYDVTTNLVVVSADATDKKMAVSPMVFVPSIQNKVAFIQDEALVEYDFTKQEKTVITTNVSASRPVHEGPTLPNPPYYSNDGNYIAFYNKNGDLLVLNKSNKNLKSLAQGYKSEFFSENYPSGFIVGFNKQNDFIFTAIDKDGYQYGTNVPIPVYIYSTRNGQVKNFPIADDSTDLSSLIFAPNLEKIVSHSSYTGYGLTVHSPEGKILKDCSKTDFRYSFYNWGGGPNYSSALKVWSNDGRYILSQSGETLMAMNIETCGVSTLLNDKFNTAMWLPQ